MAVRGETKAIECDKCTGWFHPQRTREDRKVCCGLCTYVTLCNTKASTNLYEEIKPRKWGYCSPCNMGVVKSMLEEINELKEEND